MEVDFEDFFEVSVESVTVVWRGIEGTIDITEGDGGELSRGRLVGEGEDIGIGVPIGGRENLRIRKGKVGVEREKCVCRV